MLPSLRRARSERHRDHLGGHAQVGLGTGLTSLLSAMTVCKSVCKTEEKCEERLNRETILSVSSWPNSALLHGHWLMNTLAVQLFGAFRLTRDQQPLPPTRKEQWLLALLLLRAPHPLERAWL